MSGDGTALTFDTDWAPDSAIELCADLCSAYGVKSTFFATNPSPVVRSFLNRPDIEVGIHPNFLAGSSQGETPEEVIATCLGFVPEARSMRTHALVQSSPLLEQVVSQFPQLYVDTSLLLPGHPHLVPVDHWVGTEGNRHRLVRLPTFWEDDVAAEHPAWTWSGKPSASPGLRIYNFHPVHVALNTDRMARYRSWQKSLDGRPAPTADAATIESLRNKGRGARTYLEDVLATVGAAGSTVSELADAHISAFPSGRV